MRVSFVTFLLAGTSVILPAVSALATPHQITQRGVSRRHNRHHHHAAANALFTRSGRRTKSCPSRPLKASTQVDATSTASEAPAEVVSSSVAGGATAEAKPSSSAAPVDVITSTSRIIKATSTTAAAAATSQASSSGGSTGSLTSDQQEYLKIHNDLRAKHGASALTWSTEAEAAAQAWANKCVFEHGGGKAGGFGENLSAGSTPFSISSALQLWVNEGATENNFNHFTQMVWKGTTQVGCAVASCPKGTVFADFAADFYVCEYSPAGNVIGAFDENVQI